MYKYFKLSLTFRKIQFMRLLEYRADYFFWAFISLMWTAFNYFYFGLLFSGGRSVEGWSYDQVLLIISFYTMLDAVVWSVMYPNMRAYTNEIFNGTLSKFLVQPVNTLFLITTPHSTYHNIPRFITGFAILLYACQKLQLSFSIWSALGASFIFLVGIILIYSLWIILATTAFWFEKLENVNEIIPAFRSVHQVPVQIFTGIPGFVLSFIIPLGLVTTLPSQFLLGTQQSLFVAVLLCSTIFFATIAVVFFNISIKKYSSVGG